VEEANLIAVVVRMKMRVVEEESIGKYVMIVIYSVFIPRRVTPSFLVLLIGVAGSSFRIPRLYYYVNVNHLCSSV